MWHVWRVPGVHESWQPGAGADLEERAECGNVCQEYLCHPAALHRNIIMEEIRNHLVVCSRHFKMIPLMSNLGYFRGSIFIFVTSRAQLLSSHLLSCHQA